MTLDAAGKEIPQGAGGEKPPVPAGGGEKPPQGATGEKPAGQAGDAKYTQAQMDDIQAQVRANERKTVLDEQKAESDRKQMTADQRATAAEADAKAARDLTTFTQHENAVLKLNLTSGDPVPPAYIDTALKVAIAAGGNFDPAKVLTTARDDFSAWAKANGFVRQTGTPPAGDGKGATKPGGSTPPAEGRQAGASDDFETTPREVVNARCAKDPEYQKRYMEHKRNRYKELTGRG